MTIVSKSQRERFTIEVQDAGSPDDPPVVIRLRRFLKAALRAYGLRCVSAVGADLGPVVEEVPAGHVSNPPTPSSRTGEVG